MTSERWNRLKDIFDAALTCEPEARNQLLDDRCAGDDDLRAEIEVLLAHTSPARDFLEESPPVQVASFLPAEPAPTFSQGELLSGRFRIISLLGRGGMGEVYEAEDLTLGGRIAVKTIRPEISSDHRIMARFRREIQLSRSITHPNVCRVFDIASDQLHAGRTTTYLTMEMLTGETLSAYIGRKEPLDVSRVLPLVWQMAEGLAAAHRAGIIHRDFKPSNVFLAGQPREALRVVVTDFGLACTLDRELSGDPSVTGSQTIMGTPAYMAPEQLEGKPISAAADVYAFGLVICRILTGAEPFPEMGTFSGALKRLHLDPVVPYAHASGLGADWQRLILRCLERDPERRFADANHVLVALSALQPLRKRTARWPSGVIRKRVAAAAVIAGVAAGATAWMFHRAPQTSSAPFSLEEASFLQLTNSPGQELYPTISPDGSQVIYSGQSGDSWDLFLQRIGEKSAVNLTRDSRADNTQPSFSPDGHQIAFRSERDGGGIFLMPSGGGPATRIADSGYFPSWSPDGRKIVFSTASFTVPARRPNNSRLVVLDLATGNQQLLNLKGDAIQATYSARGNRIAFWRLRSGHRDICTVASNGASPVCITDDAHVNWNPVWSPDGRYLYFASDRGGSMNLWRVPIDEDSGKASGAFTPVSTPSPYSGYFSMAHNGGRMAFSQLLQTSNLEKVPFDARRQIISGEPLPVTRGSQVSCCPDPSPDGRQLAFGTGGGREGVSLINTDGTGERQLTANEFRNRQPRWSPDGRLLAFTSNRTGPYEVWTIRPDGKGLRQLTANGDASIVFCAWSPDGKRLFYDLQNSTPHIIDPEKPWNRQKPTVLPPPDGPNSIFAAWNWSPDGTELVGDEFRADGSPGGIFIYSMKTQRYQELTGAGSFALWLRDGYTLIFQRQGKLFLSDSRTHLERELLSVSQSEIVPDFAVAPDQKTIYFRLSHTEADVWLLGRQQDKWPE